jgi:hypothetical protein
MEKSMNAPEQLVSLVNNLKKRFKDNQLDLNGAEMDTLVRLAETTKVMSSALFEALEAVKKERDIANEALQPFEQIARLVREHDGDPEFELESLVHHQLIYRAEKAYQDSRPALEHPFDDLEVSSNAT